MIDLLGNELTPGDVVLCSNGKLYTVLVTPDSIWKYGRAVTVASKQSNVTLNINRVMLIRVVAPLQQTTRASLVELWRDMACDTTELLRQQLIERKRLNAYD